jgi:TolB protein
MRNLIQSILLSAVCMVGSALIAAQARETRILTDGLGSNESPTFSPSGRHLAFMSTRAGKAQIFTITRNGNGLAQITRVGNNTTPNWSH